MTQYYTRDLFPPGVKPCPLCGNEIRVIDNGGVFVDFWCHHCTLSMVGELDELDECVERWNRRVYE